MRWSRGSPLNRAADLPLAADSQQSRPGQQPAALTACSARRHSYLGCEPDRAMKPTPNASATITLGRAMPIMMVLVTIVTAAVATPMAFGGPSQHPSLLGTWQIDPSSSQYHGRAPLRSGTMRFEAVSAGGVHVICDVMTASGIPFHFEYTGPEDGSVHPVTGNPYYDRESTIWTDLHTATRTEIRGSTVIGSSTMTLAADGKSFTAVSRRSAPEDGHLYTSTIVWKLTAGS